ncbi:hypothetical protein D3P07_00915 [Paenibacillus sp. 1011MAR3C5]|uniref:hypothetical protein n=1 Tax=Paenibacillus sp. 1011MAR3C5 TaxID=1675787 RepID=UPI000E6BFCEE|nr:hypothetical protein [Paenibacillus sp. 1011MAR3C5]RJE90699.1 hypothetical protein D3P07_00915 [Paenibacillus sp. 1011MAR3C5]
MTNKLAEGRDWAADLATCDATTAGPWTYEQSGEYDEGLFCGGDGYAVMSFGSYPDEYDQSCGEAPNEADASFIAEARTGWPAALADIEWLRGVLARFDDSTNPMLPRSEMARIAKEALDATGGYAIEDAEIRRLRVENRRYRQALETIAGLTMSIFASLEDMAKYAKRTARLALEHGESGGN